MEGIVTVLHHGLERGIELMIEASSGGMLSVRLGE